MVGIDEGGFRARSTVVAIGHDALRMAFAILEGVIQ
jgi:hypothetical protein